MSQVQTSEESPSLLRREWIALGALAVLLLLVSYWGGSGPVTWDELLYMDHSLNLDDQGWIVRRSWFFNRYWHIYLQAGFMRMTGDAMTGARLFWGFLFAVSTVFVYLTARLLAKTHRRLIGCIAVLLFLSLRVVVGYMGVTYADFTLLAHLAVLSFLYLKLRESEGLRDAILLFLFGLLFFLTIKSRELGVCAAPLLLGAGFGREGDWSLAMFFKRSVFIAAGFLVGTFANLLLDSALVTGAPFWELPERTPKTVPDPRRFEPVVLTPFHPLTEKSFLLPTILFAASFPLLVKLRYSIQEKLLWLVPLAALFILFIRAFLTHHDTYDRYLLAVVPFLCFGGAQTFQVFSGAGRGLWKPLGAAGCATLAVGVVFKAAGWPDWPSILSNWDPKVYYETILYPVGGFGCLTLLFLVPRWTRGWIFLFGVFFWLGLLPALKTNLVGLVTRSAVQSSQERFSPLLAFQDKIQLSEGQRLFVSSSLFDKLETFGRDPVTCSRMFNVFNNADTHSRQFIRNDPKSLIEAAEEYDYILMTVEDWADLEEAGRSQEDSGIVLFGAGAAYTREEGPGGAFILLTRS